MTIAICCSLTFHKEAREYKTQLEKAGHFVYIPPSIERMKRGEITFEEIERKKKDGTFAEYVRSFDAISKYYEIIQNSDAILVLNFPKNGVENYIGGNTFLEMGFAHVLKKKIFVLFSLPNISYLSEIESMSPVCLKGDLGRLKL